ncbi:ATP-binding protein [Dehalococcoides mccartyi]|uniref:ATP-binding protein n=1 Tax=Dehalococcoides mccartyi TaxID=61435 RepID=UPI002FCB8E0B
MEEKVRDTLARYQNDEVMLDAFFQWATNPTSMSAGYGLEENYPYIKKNLALRHGLTPGEAEKHLSTLKEICGILLTEAEQLPDDKYRIGHVQKRLSDILCQGDYKDLRLQGVLRRLKEASEETRKALLLFNLLEDDGASVSAVNFTNPPAQYSNHQSEFQAYYKSIFGEVSPVLRVAREIVAVGAYNELYWVPSPTAKSRAQPILVKAMLPSNAELEGLGSRLPPEPDVPEILEAYWEKDTEVLRLVDIISHTLHGVAEIDEPLPVNIPKFIGLHGKTAAFSPAIRNDAKQYTELAKDEKLFPVRQTLEKALLAVEKLVEPEAGLGVLWTEQGEVVWKFTTTPPLYVYLAPWLSTSIQTLAPSRINFQEKPHVLFVIPYQSRASFVKSLERHSGYSLKETRWEKSLGLLTDLERTEDFQLIVGQRHPFVDKVLAAISEISQPTGKPVKPSLSQPSGTGTMVSPEPSPRPSPEPLLQPTPKLTGELVLGDIVSKEELNTFIHQSGLTEDKRREALASLGPLTYPIATATTHTAIFGTTGSGKSVTTKRLARELVGHGVPVTIIDWHDEYVDLIRQVGGIIAVPPTSTTKPNASEVPFTWNVLDPRFYSPEVTPQIIEDYIEIVVDLLGHKDLMALTEPMKGGLTEALRLAYEKNLVPTFKDVLALISEVPIPPATADALQRRLQRFSGGSLGSIFCSETSFDPASMFSTAMNVRVKHLTADHQSAVGLLTFFLLRQAISHFKRIGEVNDQAPVRHIIIIDEAPMVIGSNPKVEHEVIRMLQEVRKFGEGLILVCRNPSIDDDILRETNQKIAHKLDVPRDVSSVASMMGLSAEDKKLLHSLPRGIAFARIAGNPTVLARVKGG